MSRIGFAFRGTISDLYGPGQEAPVSLREAVAQAVPSLPEPALSEAQQVALLTMLNSRLAVAVLNAVFPGRRATWHECRALVADRLAVPHNGRFHRLTPMGDYHARRAARQLAELHNVVLPPEPRLYRPRPAFSERANG